MHELDYCQTSKDSRITRQIESAKVVADIMSLLPNTDRYIDTSYVLEVMSLAGLKFEPVTKAEEAITAYDRYRAVERY